MADRGEYSRTLDSIFKIFAVEKFLPEERMIKAQVRISKIAAPGGRYLQNRILPTPILWQEFGSLNSGVLSSDRPHSKRYLVLKCSVSPRDAGVGGQRCESDICTRAMDCPDRASKGFGMRSRLAVTSEHDKRATGGRCLATQRPRAGSVTIRARKP